MADEIKQVAATEPVSCILNGSVVSGGGDVGGKVDKDNESLWFTLGRGANGLYYNPNGEPSEDAGASVKYVDAKITTHNDDLNAHKELFDEVRIEILETDPEAPGVNELWINENEELYVPYNEVTSFNGRINDVTPQPKDYTPEFIGAADKHHSYQHSIYGSDPVTPEMIGAGRVNPNLLDNWYFGNPVNQRAITSWDWDADGFTGGYTWDRWVASDYKYTYKGKFHLTTDGVVFDSIVKGGSDTYGLTISQISETAHLHEQHTFSILFDGNLYSVPVRFNGKRHYAYLVSSTVQLAYNDTTLSVGFYPSAAGKTWTAAKLELGSQQTLAHQENGEWVLNEIPNYAEQLAICKQYDPDTGKYIGMLSKNEMDEKYAAKAQVTRAEANNDYLAMKMNVELPPDPDKPTLIDDTHSKHFADVKKYYDNQLWTESMVNEALNVWLTQEEVNEILNK